MDKWCLFKILTQPPIFKRHEPLWLTNHHQNSTKATLSQQLPAAPFPHKTTQPHTSTNHSYFFPRLSAKLRWWKCRREVSEHLCGLASPLANTSCVYSPTTLSPQPLPDPLTHFPSGRHPRPHNPSQKIGTRQPGATQRSTLSWCVGVPVGLCIPSFFTGLFPYFRSGGGLPQFLFLSFSLPPSFFFFCML